MSSSAPNLKTEENGSEELHIQDIVLEAPEGFEQLEWATLTDGWSNEQEEIDYWISLRGKGGSGQGRPTNFRAGFKGKLSDTARAIQQRNRAAQRSIEEEVLSKAGDADRSAKRVMLQKLRADPTYQSYTNEQQEIARQDKIEDLDQERYNQQKSREWIEGKFRQTHVKWRRIRQTVAQRKHQNTLAKFKEHLPPPATTHKEPGTRADRRLFGSGGVLEKWLRRVYAEGATMLETEECDNDAAQKEWQEWCDKLTPKELAIATDPNWQQREPSPPPEYTYDKDDIILTADRPYIQGGAEDECEEEIDDGNDSEIDKWIEEQPNEYETNDQYYSLMDRDDDEETWGGFSDDEMAEDEEDEETWNGFSDDEQDDSEGDDDVEMTKD